MRDTIRTVMETQADRLRAARKKAGYETTVDFSSKFDLVESTYRSHDNGTRPLTVPVAKRYAKLLNLEGLTWQWLMFGDEIPLVDENTMRTPRKGDTSAANMLSIDELDVRGAGGMGAVHEADSLGSEPEKVLARWQMPATLIRGYTNTPAEHIKIITVVGESMVPVFNPGDKVMVDLQDLMPSPAGIFALWDGYGQIIKRLEIVPYSDPATVVLKSANAAYETRELPLEQLIINGRVIGRWLWT